MEDKKELIRKLRDEQRELFKKIHNLYKFRKDENYSKISLTQRILLDCQLKAMETYAEVLSSRIIDLESEK